MMVAGFALGVVVGAGIMIVFALSALSTFSFR